MILLMGSSRSGTSWVGKIFDSHPATLYLHEPDSVIRNNDIPFLFSDDDDARYENAARAYLAMLAGLGVPKSTCTLPVFRKDYQNLVERGLKRATVYGAKALGSAARVFGTSIERVNLPRFARTRNEITPRCVLKSVSSLGRAPLFGRAMPDAKIVHILRHPCGYVASRLHGASRGLMSDDAFAEEHVQIRDVRDMGLSVESVTAMTIEEKFALSWVAANQQVQRRMNGQPNYYTLNYEALCLDPKTVTRDVFAFCDLPWSGQTDRFLDLCMSPTATDAGYYQVIRNPRESAFKWKQELSDQQVARILGVVKNTTLGALYT